MIKQGDIIFIMHHASLMSKAFAWFMNSKWSHCAIIADVCENEIYLHESSDTQTKVGMLSIYAKALDDEIEVIHLPFNKKQAQLASDTASIWHNKMYGYVRLLGAGLRRLLIKAGWKKAPMLLQLGGPLCMMIPHSGIYAVRKDISKVGSIDTEDLYQWCLANGKTVAVKKRGDNALSMA